MESKIEKDIIQIENLQDKLKDIKKLCQVGSYIEEAIHKCKPDNEGKHGLNINGVYVNVSYEKLDALLKQELQDVLSQVYDMKESFKKLTNQ